MKLPIIGRYMLISLANEQSHCSFLKLSVIGRYANIPSQ
jgi:hypothetical protein